jgi:hypothetical protein
VNKSRNRYLVAATVVWVAIWVATGVVADNEFGDMVPILGGGTVFFIVVSAGGVLRNALLKPGTCSEGKALPLEPVFRNDP